MRTFDINAYCYNKCTFTFFDFQPEERFRENTKKFRIDAHPFTTDEAPKRVILAFFFFEITFFSQNTPKEELLSFLRA